LSPIQYTIIANEPILTNESSFPQTSHYQITEQRQEAPSFHFLHWVRVLPTPYPLSYFSPKEHLQDERFIFCEIFRLSSAEDCRPGCAGQFQEGSLSCLPHRQGHTAPKWLQQKSRKAEMATAGTLSRPTGVPPCGLRPFFRPYLSH
jgi:hypothetical protein